MIALTIVATLLAGALFWWLVFDDFDDFVESVKHGLTPDFVSMLRGDFWADMAGEFKLFMWLIPTVAVGAGAWFGLGAVLG